MYDKEKGEFIYRINLADVRRSVEGASELSEAEYLEIGRELDDSLSSAYEAIYQAWQEEIERRKDDWDDDEEEEDEIEL